jgi:DNA-binding NarL/FixJ family response regulator
VAIVGGVGTFFTEALACMLAESGSRVLGAYPNPAELQAEAIANSTEVQVVVIDADDPAAGVAMVSELRCGHRELKILLLCERLTPPVARCAMEEHVEGVVLKSDSVEEVIVAFRHILDGRAVMPAGWQAAALQSERDPIDSLSTREREVLELAAGGMRNWEIAERLMISTNTVKFHLRTIYRRLGVRNRVQAMQAVGTSHGEEAVAESVSAESQAAD